ncbi:hypothetical protein K439DRAFT_1626926 [Ramaria rubella]|nr:hypothetical protein K439DRAFT_1626926 [Ramaria rubella]
MSQPLHNTVLQETENDKGEDDMPDASSLLHTNERRRSEQAREEKEHKKRNLEELRKQKQKFQNISKAGPSCNGSDSEDELEVVDMMLSSSSEHKIAAVHSTIQRPFHGRIDEADYSAISPRNLEPISRKNLELAARPKFLAQQTSSRNRGQQSTFSQKTLNNALLQRADSQNGAIEEKKKEEWMKAGGVFKERAPEAEKTSIADWLWKGSTRGSTRNVEDGDDDDDDHDDDDDPEYHPGNLDNRELERKTSDAGHNDNVQDDECISDQRMVISEEDTDKENHRPVSRRSKAWAIVASDDEDEMTDRKRSLSPVVLVPDSSFLENSDDIPGGDKENSAELAFSVSENKENEGVPRHHERGRIVRPNVHDDSFAFLSPSFGSQSGNNLETSREPLSRLDDEEELAFMPHAMVHGQEASTDRVLQVLHEEDREATLASVGTLRKALHRKLSSTPSEVEDVELPTLTPPTGFSQLFASQDIVEGPIPASGVDDGRFSQFFEQNRETPLKGKRDYFAFQQRPTEQESKDEDFEFTQPNALLPSVKISESQRREIDEMFGKDQEFKLDEAKKSKQPSRPASNAMDPLNFGSFTPSQPVPLSPQSIRRPLETLSLHSKGRETPLDESPQAGPIRRSRLLRERPQRRSSSLSPSSAPRNAFDVLRDAGASNKQRQRVAKHSIVNSEFVEAEAQESDEEFKSGFGGLKGDDEEEGADEDQDTILEGLVDDSVMDDRDQAADLVLEKHLEHQAADDAELHRIHQAAVDGKLRGKRRDRGIAFDDSESDEEFNDPRKPSWKKRKIEGDTLDVYGQNPETRPFYETYQADLAEAESDDLRYLKDVSTQENEIQYSEEESTEVIDPADIRQKIIETSTQGFRFSSSVLDPGNANWVDFEDQDIEDMDGVQVRDGPLHPRKGPETRRSTLDHVDFRSTLQGKRPDGSEKQRLNAWARQESQTHASASGRGGFSRNDSKGSNPPRKLGKPGLVRSSTSEEGKPIAKSSSLISHVEKRRGFDH